MRVLDLYCGAGGASQGYADAGFQVLGVDHSAQPNYPFGFVKADALEFLSDYLSGFFNFISYDLIHASPPCQAYTKAGGQRRMQNEEREHPDLIAQTRELLKQTGIPYVIENVPGAPLLDPVQICGTAFRLGWEDWELQRHRLFEANWPIQGTGCNHQLPPISIVGHGATMKTREKLGRNPVIAEKKAAMQIDWMNRDELSQAIPPAYTRYIGEQFLKWKSSQSSDAL